MHDTEVHLKKLVSFPVNYLQLSFLDLNNHFNLGKNLELA